MPKVTLRNSSIHNAGIFADENIAEGTRIIEYVGEKITAKEAERRKDAQLENHRNDQANGAVYIFELNKRYSIDGNVPYNTARHINHSCDPNAETDVIRGKVWIIATRDIKAGEEITYNYGYDFDEYYKDHPCRCGAANCVGYIVHHDSWPQLRKVLNRTVIYHKDGEKACGKIAFYWIGKFGPNMLIFPEKIEFPNGSHPGPGEILACAGCSRSVMVVFKDTQYYCFSGQFPEELIPKE